MSNFQDLISHKIKGYADFALPALALLLVLFIFPLQIIPSIKTIASLSGEINNAKERDVRMETKEKMLSSQDINRLTVMLEKVNRAIPSIKDIPSIFTNIGVTAQKSSVVIESMQINAGEISSGSSNAKSTIEFQISLIGTLDRIRAFIGEINSTSRLFKIKSVVLRQTSRQDPNASFTATFDCYAYFQPLPESIGKIDEPISPLTPEEDKIANAFPEESIGTIPSGALPNVPLGKSDPFSRF